MTKLSVNVNKVALLRNSRPLAYPSPVKAAKLALEAGAAGVTVHPRPDQRHIRPEDVRDIAGLLTQAEFDHVEFNIEGNPFEGDFMALVREVQPAQATLVPDAPGQSTSDHGWVLSDKAAGNPSEDSDRLRPIIAEIQELGCRVSLFLDADLDQIAAAAQTGTDRIELYTEPYAAAHALGGQDLERTYQQFANAAIAAQTQGLHVNAGHDLTLDNLSRFLTIPGIAEVSIGHALIADAIELGLPAAVQAYLHVIERAAL